MYKYAPMRLGELQVNPKKEEPTIVFKWVNAKG